jgi:two-component sensor histidine kinase
MATNSLKYGALSCPAGNVKLAWTEEELVALYWAERGGPTLTGPPEKEGFGGTLSKMTAASLGGTIKREWLPQGLEMRLVFPATALQH